MGPTFFGQFYGPDHESGGWSGWGGGVFPQNAKNAKKTPFLYFKNHWSYEVRFHLILTGIGTFYSELLVLQTFYKRNKLKNA